MLVSKLFFSFGLLFLIAKPSSGNFKNKEAAHPFFVSVTQIRENTKEKILEISCKIFTDDFEQTLRMHYHRHIDLLNPTDKAAMNKVVNDYIIQHLKISVDGKFCPLQFVGYEKNEEGVECYFQANNIWVSNSVSVFNDLLFEYKPEQTNIVHVTVKGKRKSRELINPDAKFNFTF